MDSVEMITKEREIHRARFTVQKMMVHVLKVGAKAVQHSPYPEAWTKVLAPIFNADEKNEKFENSLRELAETLEQMRELEYKSRNIIMDVVEQSMHMQPYEY